MNSGWFECDGAGSCRDVDFELGEDAITYCRGKESCKGMTPEIMGKYANDWICFGSGSCAFMDINNHQGSCMSLLFTVHSDDV